MRYRDLKNNCISKFFHQPQLLFMRNFFHSCLVLYYLLGLLAINLSYSVTSLFFHLVVIKDFYSGGRRKWRRRARVGLEKEDAMNPARWRVGVGVIAGVAITVYWDKPVSKLD